MPSTMRAPPRTIRVHETHVGVSSKTSIAEASRTNAVTPTARATSQAARKVRLVARALGVNSSRIAGMIVKGDAAMAIASGTTSAVIASMGASCAFA